MRFYIIVYNYQKVFNFNLYNREASKQSSFSTDIEVSSVSTSIKYIEHVVVTISVSFNLQYYDNVYDYDDLYEHYSNLRNNEVEFYDFEDLLEENPKAHSKKDDDYPWLSSNNHARRGDIKIELTSPSGTKSVLLPYREFDFINAKGYQEWPFMSLHHWGENPIGNWVIQVTYNNYHASVNVEIHTLEMYGTSEVPQAVRQIPLTCDPACAKRCAAVGSEYCDVCTDLRDSETLDCISDDCLSLNFTEYNHYCVDSIHYNNPDSPGTDSPGTDSSSDSPSDSSDSNSSPSLVLPLVLSIGCLLFFIVVAASGITLAYVFTKHRKLRSPSQYHAVEIDDISLNE